MHGEANNRQNQDALLRVFFMFVAMTLLLIRVGLAARARSTPLATAAEPQCDALTVLRSPHEAERSDLYAVAVELLLAAEAAVDRMFGMAQERYEVLGQRDAIARATSSLALARHPQPALSPQPIDSS